MSGASTEGSDQERRELSHALWPDGEAIESRHAFDKATVHYDVPLSQAASTVIVEADPMGLPACPGVTPLV